MSSFCPPPYTQSSRWPDIQECTLLDVTSIKGHCYRPIFYLCYRPMGPGIPRFAPQIIFGGFILCLKNTTKQICLWVSLGLAEILVCDQTDDWCSPHQFTLDGPNPCGKTWPSNQHVHLDEIQTNLASWMKNMGGLGDIFLRQWSQDESRRCVSRINHVTRFLPWTEASVMWHAAHCTWKQLSWANRKGWLWDLPSYIWPIFKRLDSSR